MRKSVQLRMSGWGSEYLFMNSGNLGAIGDLLAIKSLPLMIKKLTYTLKK
jgi:hypothetical protein